MDYQDNESGLKQLLSNLEHVQGTFPPVYRYGGFLIGYDKTGRLRVLGKDLSKPSAQTISLFRRLRALVWPFWLPRQ